jgi:hypothetical protein
MRYFHFIVCFNKNKLSRLLTLINSRRYYLAAAATRLIISFTSKEFVR